jgi:hypothetical protein
MKHTTATRVAKGPAEAAEKERVLTKAIIKAAEWLDLKSVLIAEILGISPATISRMKTGAYSVKEGDKSYELGAFFIRAYRSLFAITGGDQTTAREWLRCRNTALKGVPLELMKTVRGLYEVCGYLDARRSVV